VLFYTPGCGFLVGRLSLFFKADFLTPEPVAMVAKAPCNLTPRHPPSQVLDNLPEIGG
jgi:hypothetical protein